MADPIEPSPRTRPSYGWIACGTCRGTGKTRHFRGNSATITHLARGGNPHELPCGDCYGNGRLWAPLPTEG